MARFFGKSQEEKEIERNVKYKQGLTKVQNYVQKCNQAEKRYWELGKRALKLGDQKQFENIAKAYLRTREMANKWERYTVMMETVSLRRDQIKTTGVFASSMSAMSSVMMTGANPEDITKMQVGLEKALARAETLDETLSAVMDATTDTIYSSEGLSEESLKEVAAIMSGEAVHEEGEVLEKGEALDERIASGLKRIEEQMKEELK
ncbi:MAG: hypothetical protein GY852_10970 [bacterium]|nr:hypothetical protein [bacterium]